MNPFEQEVREMLRTKVSKAPVRDEPPPVVLRRSKTLRAVNGVGIMAAAAAVVLGIVLGAQTFGGGEPVTPDAPVDPGVQVVPWRPLPASSSDGVIDLRPPTGRPCTADDIDPLLVTAIGVGFPASNENVSCTIDPHADGFSVSIRDVIVRFGEVPVTIEVGETAPIIHVDGSKPRAAGLFFTWRNYCDRELDEANFDFTLPGGGSVASSGKLVPPSCDIPNAPSRMTFDAGGWVGGFFTDDPPVVPNLGYTISAPATVSRGSTLVYRVRVVNRLSEDVRMISPCPNYAHGFQRGDFDAAHTGNRLNCEGATDETIPAGGVVEFEMRLDVDSTLEPGDWALFWVPELGPRIDTPATARIRVL